MKIYEKRYFIQKYTKKVIYISELMAYNASVIGKTSQTFSRLERRVLQWT
ncbi:hypothetical protein HMPREF3033_00974 [Veillonellaceae bacterium DNF00751]|nr:hypothetical protein HMPREF3033_00974 [Veillonellaceae bacterium DNF00751]